MKKQDKRYAIVQEAILKKGYTQRGLAKKINCKQNAVWVFLQNLKNGKKPRVNTLRKYAEALEIPLEKLIKQ